MSKPRRQPAIESAPTRSAAWDRTTLFWVVCSIALVVLAFALYSPSLKNGFVFDDADLIVNDHKLRSFWNLSSSLANNYRPLRTISYALDYAVWGLNPTGFRITNILIHAGNCVLALLVARRVTGGARVASLVAALVFAVHPVQVESVAYISGRRDVLFTLFFLAGFLAYAQFRDATVRSRRYMWLGATAVLFLLSLASKEMAASFPLVCALWDVWRATALDDDNERPPLGDVIRRIAREGVILYAVAVAALAGFAYYTIEIRRATTRLIGADIEYWGGSALNNLLTVPLTYAHYVFLTVWPRTLAAQYYGAFDPASGFSDPRVIPAVILLLALSVGSLWLIVRTTHRVAGFGVAWFLVTLLPASQIIPHHEIVADHYLYLPMFGAGLFLAGGLIALERAGARELWQRVALGACIVAIALLAARSVVRERDWLDEATLWEATYKAVPQSPRAAYNYGLVLTNRGEHQRAIPYYEETIQRDPTFVKAYFNLASTYATLGRIDDARDVYRAALASDIGESARSWHLSPDVVVAMYQTELAWLNAQSGETAGARDDLAGILARQPDMLRTQEFYASVLQMRGEIPQTIADLTSRVAANPASMADRAVLASLLWKTGRLDDARTQLEVIYQKNQNSPFANLYLGRYYREVRAGNPQTSTTAADYFAKAETYALTPFDIETVKRAAAGGPPRA